MRTRIPDFVADYQNGSSYHAELRKPLIIDTGEHLNLTYRVNDLRSRDSYFGASYPTSASAGSPTFSGMAVGVFESDPLQRIDDWGLEIHRETFRDDAPHMSIVVERTPTHQTVDFTLSHAGQVYATYHRRQRIYFSDELGASQFRHHVLHLMKNTLWNRLAMTFEPARTQFSVFFLRALVFAEGDSVNDATPLYRVQAVKSVTRLESRDIERLPFLPPMEVIRCARSDVPALKRRSLGLWVGQGKSKEYFPAPRRTMRQGIEPGFNPHVGAVACGDDGYLVWVRAAPTGSGVDLRASHRLVLVDRAWTKLAYLDFEMDEFYLGSVGHRRSVKVVDMYQDGERAVIRLVVAEQFSDGQRASIVEYAVHHDLLQSDFGRSSPRMSVARGDA